MWFGTAGQTSVCASTLGGVLHTFRVIKFPDFTDSIIRAYLGQPVSQRTLRTAVGRLELESAGYDEPPYTELQAAVAEVLLKSVRQELPQWAVVRETGVTLGRRAENRFPCRRRYRPATLFEINWANSGPGFSWPMRYCATRVRWADAVIVTASADSPDAYGWTDFAIGHFTLSKETNLLAGIGEVIVSDWAQQATQGQRRWEELFGEGAVSGAVAERWADLVDWPAD